MIQSPLQKTWIRILLTLLTVAMMVVIFQFSAQDAAKSDQTSGKISQAVVTVVHPEYEKSSEEKKTEIFNSVQHAVRKTAHFSEYLALGVLLMIPLQPVLQAPVLQPAFASVVPALFGAMACQYYRKDPGLAAVPLCAMSLLFILVPSLISSTSMMIIPSGAIAIGLAYLKWRKARKEAA